MSIETDVPASWRIEGLKIIGPTGEICTMTYDQARGGIGAHEIVPTQKLIAQAPVMLEVLRAFVSGTEDRAAFDKLSAGERDRLARARAVLAAIET